MSLQSWEFLTLFLPRPSPARRNAAVLRAGARVLPLVDATKTLRTYDFGAIAAAWTSAPRCVVVGLEAIVPNTKAKRAKHALLRTDAQLGGAHWALDLLPEAAAGDDAGPFARTLLVVRPERRTRTTALSLIHI